MGEESILIKGFGARRGSQVVRPGTANPLFAGSIPARASKFLRNFSAWAVGCPGTLEGARAPSESLIGRPYRSSLLSLCSGSDPRLHSSSDHFDPFPGFALSSIAYFWNR